MNTCPPRQELEQFLQGTLDADQAHAIDVHIGACRTCDATLTQMTATIAQQMVFEPGEHPSASASQTVRVPGYRILEELGAGGMGVVWKAEQLRLKRIVALKMTRAGVFAGAEEQARFRGEAEAAARLRHPHIVSIYEAGIAEQGAFFVMEYVDGPSLAKKLDGTPWPVEEAVQLMRSLANAMQHAHEQGIIHRDLKPGNVLLTSTGIAKVADFGLAKRLDVQAEYTRTGQMLGTPCFMAPEQATGRIREIGPATDIHALGAILYQLLTGRPPFRGNSDLETLEQVRTEEPIPPRRLRPGLPRDLETICLKCLAKEPRRRYATAQELSLDLGRYLAHEPIQARPASTWYHAAKFARRHRTLVAATALTTITLVTALVVVSVLYAQKVRAESSLDAVQAEALAEAHARRGAWPQALAIYDDLLPASLDRDRIQLGRLHALLALNRRQDARTLLSDLAREPALGNRLGTLKLLEGELALGNRARRTEAFALLRSALESGTLSEADTAYAKGLLAEGSIPALEYMHAALASDPSHHGAGAASIVLLVSLGKRDDARRELRIHQSYFPDDRSLDLCAILLSVLESPNGDWKTQLNGLQNRLSSSQMQSAEQLFREVAALVSLLDNTIGGSAGEAFGKVLEEAPGHVESVWKSLAELERTGLAWPVLHGLAMDRSWGELLTAMHDAIRKRPDLAIARLERVIQDHPESYCIGLCGFVYAEQAELLFRVPRERDENMARSREMLRRARDAPRATPGSELTYRWFGLWADLLSWPTKQSPELRSQVRKELSYFAELDHPTIEEVWPQVVKWSIQVNQLDVAHRALAPRQVTREEQRAALVNLADAETKAGNFVAAVRVADRVLASDPNHKAAQARRADALSALRQWLSKTK